MIAAFALTEANAGSDAASISTSAVKDGDHYVLNGTKQFITNGDLASFFMVFAKTDSTRGVRGISTIIAEGGTPGLSIGRAEDKMGIRGSSQTQVIFENARVPADNLLGREGEGFRIAMSVLDRARPGVGAQACGLAQQALDLATKYAKERVVFGSAIAEFQAVRFMLAEMATQLEAARLMTYKASKLASDGKGRFSMQAAMTKLFASEMAHFVVDKALQIHGGYGYMKDYTIERLYRDQRIMEIFEGTTEIQKHVIAGALLR
jgi:butyryl-CoA dehydrogenase